MIASLVGQYLLQIFWAKNKQTFYRYFLTKVPDCLTVNFIAYLF